MVSEQTAAQPPEPRGSTAALALGVASTGLPRVLKWDLLV